MTASFPCARGRGGARHHWRVDDAERILDDGAVAVFAHVVLQHLSVVSAALALLTNDSNGRPRPPPERLLEQATDHTAQAVELLRDLIRGVPPA